LQGDNLDFRYLKLYLKARGSYLKQGQIVKLKAKQSAITSLDIALFSLRNELIPRFLTIEKALGHLKASLSHSSVSDCLRIACLKKILKSTPTLNQEVVAFLNEILVLQDKRLEL
jgi:hypothetical protein